ncbi:hypothetical protein [Pengzhenrongella sicca]|uniref:Uncharacterized protein n=1 Tax=Pengzhenrongella sicca TaxID=2819238 RepID=A0A8A4ZEA9_9MICO|nr:hypothetical protein [Pengzhenrongella sicca]QTE29359.1 hypothetical protein J4E96_19150 [Pengzhenrongella sicca]
MSLQMRDRVATLSGVLTVDEVEPLVAWLRATRGASVNLRECTHLHTGAFQALLCFRPKVSAAPRDPFLAAHVFPWLTSTRPPPMMKTGGDS